MNGKGRVGIFGRKEGGDRYQGIVGKVGARKFEQARAKLAKLAKWPVEKVSDGDVFEALARGWDDVRTHLAKERHA